MKHLGKSDWLNANKMGIASKIFRNLSLRPYIPLPSYWRILYYTFNPLSPGVLDPGNYPGGVLRTHSYILPFLGFFMPPSINVKPHIPNINYQSLENSKVVETETHQDGMI